jgi:hypothetical protein
MRKKKSDKSVADYQMIHDRKQDKLQQVTAEGRREHTLNAQLDHGACAVAQLYLNKNRDAGSEEKDAPVLPNHVVGIKDYWSDFCPRPLLKDLQRG